MNSNFIEEESDDAEDYDDDFEVTEDMIETMVTGRAEDIIAGNPLNCCKYREDSKSHEDGYCCFKSKK